MSNARVQKHLIMSDVQCQHKGCKKFLKKSVAEKRMMARTPLCYKHDQLAKKAMGSQKYRQFKKPGEYQTHIPASHHSGRSVRGASK